MDEKRIEQIVLKVFEKAKKEHASHTRFALSNHISEHSDLSSKTLERAYDRYINKQKKFGAPHADSVNLFCVYLGYDNYADFQKKNRKGNKERKWITITVSIAFGTLLLYIGIQNWLFANRKGNIPDNQCMAWADTVYIKVDCATQPFSKFGTKVEPLDASRLNNLKKVEVNMASDFFTEDGKPMIWYSKNKDGEIEFFSAPGLHPITGETLKKITPYIIETYVPAHINRKGSFVQEQ